MLDHSYLELKLLSESVLLSNINTNDLTCNKWLSKAAASTVLRKEFIDKVDKHTPIEGVLIFMKPANLTSRWPHIDINTDLSSNLYALNIVLPTEDYGHMEWFEFKDSKSPTIQFDTNNRQYCHCNPEDIVLVDSFALTTKPTLIRTDIPHVVKTGDTVRYCISIRFKHNYTSWDEVVNSYKDFV